MCFDGTSWVNVPKSSGSLAVNDLTDATITNVQDNDTLCYDAATSMWVNTPKTSGVGPFVMRTETGADFEVTSFSNIQFGANTLLNTGPFQLFGGDSFIVPDDSLIYDVRMTMKLRVPELGVNFAMSMFWGGSSRNNCVFQLPPYDQMFSGWNGTEYTQNADRTRTYDTTLVYGCKVVMSELQSVQIRFGNIFKAAQSFQADFEILEGSSLEVCSVGPRVI